MSRPCGNVLVGVSGAIHSIQLPEYLLRFKTELADSLKVIMTKAATQMIPPNVVELYTDDPIFVDGWDRSSSVRTPHIQLPRWADVFLILPASADIIGKAANGIADDLLSTAILASPRPIVFAPAMNPSMWQNAALQRNVARLRADGHSVLDPGIGTSVTSGTWDRGLGPAPERVISHLLQIRMARLRDAYWSEATREQPRSPSRWMLAPRRSGGNNEVDRSNGAEESRDTPASVPTATTA